MSKLVDLLSRSGEQSTAPMGFGTASVEQRVNPEIILVALGLPNDAGDEANAADAFLVGPGSLGDLKIDEVAEQAGQHVWGVRVAEFSAAQAKDLRKNGCDFIVFESMSTEAGILNEEGLGVVVTVGSDLGEQVTRAIGELPLDAVLFSPAQRDLPFTIEKLVDMQLVLGLVDRPLLVEAPLGLGPGDLEALRNIGVAGVIVDIHPADKVVELRKAITALPRQKPRPTRGVVMVPRIGGEGEPDLHGPPDEDYDDDDDFQVRPHVAH